MISGSEIAVGAGYLRSRLLGHRQIVINGHPTSIRLEPELWHALRRAAMGVAASKDPHRSLSSALRVAVWRLDLSRAALRWPIA